MNSPKKPSKTSSQSAEQGTVKLRLSKAAEADLKIIDAYSFEQFGSEVADAYLRGFNELFDQLRQHPFTGHETPDLGAGIRSLTHRRHRIFYSIDNDIVLIIRILHHAMDEKVVK